MINKNKKGNIVLPLMYPLVFLTILVSVLGVVAKSEAQIYNSDNSFLKSIENSVLASEPEKELVSSIVDNSIVDFKKDFFENLIVQREASLRLLDSEFNGCSYDYVSGEKYVFYREYLSSTSQCVPQRFDEVIIESSISKLNDLITNDLQRIGLDYLFEIEEDSQVLSFKIKREETITSSSDNLIKADFDFMLYENELDLSSYLTMLSAFHSASFQISDKLKEDPSCGEGNLERFEEKFKELINDYDGSVLENYNFEFSQIELRRDLNDKDFLIIVRDSKTNDILIDTAISLESDELLCLPEFQLENSILADSLIRVKIFDSGLDPKKVSGYVVFYSYENFFSLSNPKYNAFLEVLKSGFIPEEIEVTGLNHGSGLDYVSYAFSSEDTGVELNYALVGDQQFVPDVRKTNEEGEVEIVRGIDDILLYQIYNFDEKRYEKFEPGKEIFAFVFALDDNFNYYLKEDELQQKIQSIETKLQFSPTPIGHEEEVSDRSSYTISSNLENFEKTLFVDLKNYQDEDFSHFDVYITKDKNAELNPQCLDVEFECYYFNGIGMLDSGDKKFVISSDNFIDKERLADLDYTIENDLIFSSRFIDPKTGSLVFDLDEEYELTLVPVNLNGDGLLNDYSKEFEYVEVVNDDLSFYKLERTNEDNKRITRKVFEVSDRKAPNPIRDIQTGDLNFDSFKITLPFIDLTQDQQVSHLEGSIIIKEMDFSGEILTTLSGALVEIGRIDSTIGEVNMKSGITPDFSRKKITSIEINNIVPVDESGNKLSSFDESLSVSWSSS